MSDGTTRAVLALLDAEYDALLRGDLASLPDFLPRKLALEDSLAKKPPARAELARIARAAERNATMLRAAMAGVEATLSRLRAMAAVRDELTTYTAEGALAKVAKTGRTLERKA